MSFSSPNIWLTDMQARAALVRIFNDACAEVTRQYAGRFLFFANLPLPFVDAAIEEAERAFMQAGCVGLGLCTHFAQYAITDERFASFYQYANQRKCLIFLHPDPRPEPGYIDSPAMAWTLGAPFQDTAALYQLLQSGLLERYPDIRWIVPHCGGVLPALAGRIDEIWQMNPDPHRDLAAPPSSYLRRHNVYVDCATPQVSLIRLAEDLYGEEHLLFGSDFPYIKSSLHDLRQAMQPILQLTQSGQTRQNILRPTRPLCSPLILAARYPCKPTLIMLA
ncbi:amidohydrolase [Ktedonosporobacter rubrisoli]|uniref:Amidohydrolase n=1 Tax=Ktedonosporobacter rubrisoli TaxID=2509675 RepID=A0A4P6JUQ6_KTERU|nr:amidohydrolase family protein [Ktedonosporobacter rubrisoli]QBD79377.1 amidohydrolase [Ktedonosporobacter rubrisoli]